MGSGNASSTASVVGGRRRVDLMHGERRGKGGCGEKESGSLEEKVGNYNNIIKYK